MNWLGTPCQGQKQRVVTREKYFFTFRLPLKADENAIETKKKSRACGRTEAEAAFVILPAV